VPAAGCRRRRATAELRPAVQRLLVAGLRLRHDGQPTRQSGAGVQRRPAEY